MASEFCKPPLMNNTRSNSQDNVNVRAMNVAACFQFTFFEEDSIGIGAEFGDD